MTFKTPGVYVQEISTFPPSVVAVETAVPAFVGYTERARDAGGKPLERVPTRIKSLLDFEELFGGPYRPLTYSVAVSDANAIGAITVDRTFYLYNSIRHFYANGGGACYVVSVGSYAASPEIGTDTSGLKGGVVRLASLDEPTLLVFPDGVLLGAADLGSLQVAALQQCARLQDRFMISDLRNGNTAGSQPITDFRNRVGTEDLKYGAAYYPWLETTYKPKVRFHNLTLQLSAGRDVNSLTGDAAIDDLVAPAATASTRADKVVSPINTAMGTALSLDRDNFSDLSGHFDTLLEALETAGTLTVGNVRGPFGDLAKLPRTIATHLETLRTDTTLGTVLTAEIASLQADSGLKTAIESLIGLEKNADFRACVASGRDEAAVNAAYSDLDGTGWISVANAAAVTTNATDFGVTSPAAALKQTALNAAAALKQLFQTIAAAILAAHEAAEFLATEAERPLFSQHPVYKGAAEAVGRNSSLLPASGGVTGVYAATDRSRGVWKAPANVSLTDVVGPAVMLNDEDQSGLNVSDTGKSINAIRAFAGKGTLVWGARTLAGNDNEWRYVAVRRFFNMAEESIKKATEPFVFEPNDANTWVRVRAMIENFLTVQWRSGALAGATTAEAFFVKVGLGETMTAQDILEGRMIVELGMAVVRPAEFIILKFAHKMQVS